MKSLYEFLVKKYPYEIVIKQLLTFTGENNYNCK